MILLKASGLPYRHADIRYPPYDGLSFIMSLCIQMGSDPNFPGQTGASGAKLLLRILEGVGKSLPLTDHV